MLVAQAAPRIPISGNGPIPNTMSGSRTKLQTQAAREIYMGSLVLLCELNTAKMDMNRKKKGLVTDRMTR